MIREHRDRSDTPAHAEPDDTDAPETTAQDGADTPTREEDWHRIDAQIAAAYRDLQEHPPTEEETRRCDALLDELDAEAGLNRRPETPDLREVADSREPENANAPRTAADTRILEGDAREDSFIAVERDLLEHPPTHEEIRSRDAHLDEVDAELPLTGSCDGSPGRREPPSDLPSHVEEATLDDTTPQRSPSPEKT